jgi:hypothetical protein
MLANAFCLHQLAKGAEGAVLDDAAVYAYEYFRLRSTLFLVEGAR